MNDGGPAFPTPDVFQHVEERLYTAAYEGMTLRDWFAGQALEGMNANPELLEHVTEGAPFGDMARGLAQSAYLQADAMLTERNKEDK